MQRATRPKTERSRRPRRVVIGFFVMLATAWVSGKALADQPRAPGVVGYWALEQNEGVVQIYACGWQILCGALVGIEFDHPTDPMPLTWNHRSQCDFVFITGLQPSGNGWVGRITNPKSGHSYDARVFLAASGILKLRGYFLIPTLGRTQTWTRFPGTPPAGCRMAPEDFPVAGQ
jgi:uncharacterized protein (DUF2147 family)